MVKICALDTYPAHDEVVYSQYFEKYPYSLSIFQKYAIQGIVEGNHVLVTAHTGSGKTLACEFALEYFVRQGKKVIYTMPIKSLGNQKFHEFSQKYPNISFGLITGDIKLNPDAQVLIMTAEILLNKLYQPSKNATNANSSVSFDMDIHNELACVVMDEVHYINDKERGKTWEETIILLPSHIQMVMLSATIDAPERFAKWCESRHPESGKIVYLASTYTRIVPLTHYAFIVSPVALYKVLKDKTKEEELKKHVFNKMHIVQSHDGIFAEPTFHTINNTLKLLHVKDVQVKRSFVLNQVAKHMVDNNMLPALCFVLSRKMLEQCAQEVTTSLLEDDSKVGYIVEQECEQIIRKLPNYKEYLNLPEYVKMVALLQKGIAIHHAGIMPVLREMVELLYGKGYIKLLFATETFAVGINMPTKTVLFTDICKFDGAGNRPLHSHEYTQMAGRAGRRGIDDVGNVIHLPNLYRNFELTCLRNMLKGTAQQLTSKFKISYNLIFNQILQCDLATVDRILHYICKSMTHDEIEREVSGINWQLAELHEEMDHLHASFAHLRTPVDTIQTYLQLLAQRPSAVNKRRKEIDREIQQIMDDYKFIDKDKLTVIKFNEKAAQRLKMEATLANAEQYIANNVRTIMQILIQSGHIVSTKAAEYTEEGFQEDYDLYTLTQKGSYATHLKEINCLIFSQLYADGAFTKLSALQIAMIFSCFTNATVSDDCKTGKPNSGDKSVDDLVGFIFSSLQSQLKEENDRGINTGTNYDIHYDLLQYIKEWWDCQTEPDCKRLLQRIEEEKGIFLGEFVKALLKINNVSTEFEQIAEQAGDIELLHKLQSIPTNTLKFIATNQSLYV